MTIMPSLIVLPQIITSADCDLPSIPYVTEAIEQKNKEKRNLFFFFEHEN